jgi:hypothetical protein
VTWRRCGWAPPQVLHNQHVPALRRAALGTAVASVALLVASVVLVPLRGSLSLPSVTITLPTAPR